MPGKSTSSCILSRVTLILVLLVSTTLTNPTTPLYRGRSKKYVSDQRIAELQALLALANNLKPRPNYGHGYVDPFSIGRRRRSVDFISYWKSHHGEQPGRPSPDNLEILRDRLRVE